MADILPFPNTAAPTQPIAHYIRLGESGHLKLANLQAAGHLPAIRVVVCASRLRHQKELIAALRANGAEIVLDTKAAELSALEKYAGYARSAPWSAIGDGQPLGPNHFAADDRTGIFGQIANFAVEHQMDAILAPAHFVGDPAVPNWFDVDRQSCLALRRALDQEGGASIAIDYPLIVPITTLNDNERRSEFVGKLSDLPFDNLWIRASGFGNDAAPLAARRFITSLAAFHNLGKPVVADYLGGLVGMAALAFGAVSGIAHGIAEHERFDAHSWHKPQKKSEDGNGGGRVTRVLIATLERTATIPELKVLAKARGGMKLIACGNRECCMHGLDDMIRDPRRHAAFQCFSQVADLQSVPDLSREQHFLNGRMADVVRQARQVKELKIPLEEAALNKVDPDALMKRMSEHSKRMERMRASMEDLHEAKGDSMPRAKAITRRTPSAAPYKELKK